MQHTDIAIIGAGPVGLFAVFEAGMLGMKCHVIDALDHIGGQCSALYPEKPIYDIPAHPKISAQDLIDNLEQQAAPFSPTYHLSQQVIEISGSAEEGFQLKTSKDTQLNCKVIIIAAGPGAFGPNRPPIKNIQNFENHSVFYSVRHKEALRDKNIVIAGGGDSAVDWALELYDIAKSVSVIHRRDHFRAAPDTVEKLRKLASDGKIGWYVPGQLADLEGDGTNISHVVIRDDENNLKHIKADILLPFFGLAAKLGPVADWGLNLDRNHIQTEISTSATNIPGIYAIGDIATYANKLKLILTGFAEAAAAAHDAYKIVFDGKALHFEYSTTKGVSPVHA
ncbi:MAG: NAD(P)/FAD-dependent oxidoreductase [Pseudomonadota bacterium]